VEETQYKGFILTDHKLLALTNNALQKKAQLIFLPLLFLETTFVVSLVTFDVLNMILTPLSNVRF